MSLCTECGAPRHPMQDCGTAAASRARPEPLSEVEALTKRNAELNAANIKIRGQNAELVRRLHDLAGSSSLDIDRLKRELAALQKDFAAVQSDARKWRLFTGAARIRVLGTAGLAGNRNGYAHMGFEIWTTSEAHPMVANEKVRSLEMLDKNLEIARLTQADQ